MVYLSIILYNVKKNRHYINIYHYPVFTAQQFTMVVDRTPIISIKISNMTIRYGCHKGAINYQNINLIQNVSKFTITFNSCLCFKKEKKNRTHLTKSSKSTEIFEQFTRLYWKGYLVFHKFAE